VSDLVIEVANLVKHYGDITAVADVSLRVEAGTIFGLVGPNGAGKSTTIECIEGLRTPSSGAVQVLGRLPRQHRRELFREIGVLPQHNELLPSRLRVGEVVDLWRSFHDNPLSKDETLALCGLGERQKARTSRLSGGQRRRLMIALAQVGRPRLLILDEPSSGLDPVARYNIWRNLNAFKDQGGTILVSTHYMDEAEENCDQLCLLDHGRIQVLGNPRRLMEERRMRVLVKVPDAPGLDRESLVALDHAYQVEQVEDEWFVFGATDRLYGELKQLTGQEFLEMRPARLEDLYLMTTGRAYRTGVD
jgi:ABC-2 type transport system ATP-binding protein